jgi:hypothetical protein
VESADVVISGVVPAIIELPFAAVHGSLMLTVSEESTFVVGGVSFKTVFNNTE